ncbi:MAG TPA: hypothetical protein VMG08_08815 [Allosphingosinicella sp.]|nr:hypothetical protein [Allosphingosinicella sp.]
MVTSRQFVRGVGRTMRAMDRAAKQAERQRIVRQQAMDRQAQLNAAARAAAEYEAVIEALTGAHRVRLNRRDWLTTATSPAVPEPERQNHAETAAAARLADYSPGLMTRLLRREAKVRLRLSDDIDAARWQDDADHDRAIEAARIRNAEIEAAQRLVERDPDALAAALEAHSSLGDLPFSVEDVETLFIDKRIVAVVDGLDLEDMPTETVSLLKSGKASIKDLATGKRQELHRDTICSAAVRVALEYLSALPVDEVEVVMLTDVLDLATGHIEALPVLYLKVAAQAVKMLNLERTEAYPLVERLGGHMSWTKRDGFRPINAAAFGVDLATPRP